MRGDRARISVGRRLRAVATTVVAEMHANGRSAPVSAGRRAGVTRAVRAAQLRPPEWGEEHAQGEERRHETTQRA
jgi:hypothetical protein